MKNKETSVAVADVPIAPRDRRLDGFATGEQSAHFLGVSRAMITKLCQAGKMPHQRFGRALRIPWGWLYEQVKQASSEGPRAA
jgi:excisionase family DNA binding protein